MEESCAIREQNDGQIRCVRAKRFEKPLRFRIVGRGFDIDPLIGDMAASQKIPKLIRSGGPPRTQHADPLKRRMVRSLPVLQHVVHLRIQVFGGRIPWLHEKIIETGMIDRVDRGIRVGVSREQRPLRVRKYLPRRLQEADAIHPRHALISQQQRNAIIADLQGLQQVQRAFR